MINFRLFGIQIEKKTDILAFAAFVISVGTLVAQLVNLVRGPDIVLDGPKIVTLYSSPGGDGKHYIRLAARFTYLNNGSPGYDDFLKSESATILVDGASIELEAKDFVELSSHGKVMMRKRLNDATPVALKSGEVVSHETEFVPFPSRNSSNENFVSRAEFIDKLQSATDLIIRFTVHTYGGQTLSRHCSLKPFTVLTWLQDPAKAIGDETIGWVASPCATPTSEGA